MTSRSRPNVAISGLTAAGKTTHSLLLAEHLGYRYVSATRVMLELAGLTGRDPARLWFEWTDSARQLLTDDDLTARLTERLTRMADATEATVFDTWGLPWFYEGAVVRIFIESDVRSRSWKCFLSQGEDADLGIDECLALIENKDQSTRDVFLRVHGFDVFTDKRPFDAVLDNSHLLLQPTPEAASIGISAFDEVLKGVFRFLLGKSDRAALHALDPACLRFVRDHRTKTSD